MASQKRPVSLDDGIRQIEIKEGPCPASLKINNKTTPMVYACPVKTAANGDKEQIFLYETMHTDHGFEKLTDIEFDIPTVFCRI
jgi:hypothetical protein